MRQWNYCTMIVGGAPKTRDPGEVELAYARSGAIVSTLAAKHFNHGIRTYYFGMATLSWFVHPLALLPSALLVVLVLYRREFRSRTMRALSIGLVRDD